MRRSVPCAFHKAWHVASAQQNLATGGQKLLQLEFLSSSTDDSSGAGPGRMDWPVGEGEPELPRESWEWGQRWLCHLSSPSPYPQGQVAGSPGISSLGVQPHDSKIAACHVFLQRLFFVCFMHLNLSGANRAPGTELTTPVFGTGLV